MRDVVGGVDDPVEDGLGDDRVGEQRVPVGGSPVRGENDGPAGAFGDQFVEVVGVGHGQFPHGEVVADQQGGAGPAAQPGGPGVVGVSAGEVGEQPGGLGERRGVAAAAGQLPEGLGEHGLADPDRAVQDDRLAAVEEPQGGQVSDHAGGDVGVVAEVEILDRGGGLEPGRGQSAGQPGRVAAGEFVPAEQGEQLDVAELAAAAWASRSPSMSAIPGSFRRAQQRLQRRLRAHAPTASSPSSFASSPSSLASSLASARVSSFLPRCANRPVGAVQVRRSRPRTRCGGVGRGRRWGLVGADGQDALHRAVGRIAHLQRAAAGGVEAVGSVAFGEAEDPLRGAQVVQRVIGQQPDRPARRRARRGPRRWVRHHTGVRMKNATFSGG